MLAWYFDLVSPFSWLALAEVEALGQPVAYRPILLGALLKHWGQVGGAEIAPKRTPLYRLCLWLAEQRGIPLRLPPVHPFSSLQAMRLLHAVGPDQASVRTAMELIWAEGQDVSAPDGFGRLASRLGVADPAALIDGAGAKDKLRAATDQAIARGVFGVPTLEAEGELFWGTDSMPLARAAMADPSLLRRGEMARAADLPAAQRSRPAAS